MKIRSAWIAATDAAGDLLVAVINILIVAVVVAILAFLACLYLCSMALGGRHGQ